MKIPVAAWCIFGLAAGLIYEIEQNRQQAVSLSELKSDNAVQRAAAREQKDAAEGLEQQKAALTAQAAKAEKALAALRQQLPAEPPPDTPVAAVSADVPVSPAPGTVKKAPGGAMGKFLGQMLKDPAMKTAMRSQMAGGLRMMYGDLVKQWALSPEESDNFYSMLLDKQMGMMDSGQALLQGKASQADTAAANQDYEGRLKTSLGDDLYKQYQDYQKTVADRMMVNQYQQQNGSTDGLALSPDQSKFLIGAMGDERQAQSANGGAAALANGFMNGGMAQLDDKSIDAFTQSQSELNERVDQRAATVLSPAQLTAFKAYQTQMLDMQKASMQMASKMMGGEKAGP